MPWQLEIFVADVGQGDSSLIVATDGNQTRSLLIDAGEGQCGQIVHDYVRGRLAHYNASSEDNPSVERVLDAVRGEPLA